MVSLHLQIPALANNDPLCPVGTQSIIVIATKKKNSRRARVFLQLPLTSFQTAQNPLQPWSKKELCLEYFTPALREQLCVFLSM